MSTSKLEFKDSTYLDTAFPASERIYIQGKLHPSVRVPLREVYPAVPLNPRNQALTVGILSYDGGVHFGLLADRAR